METLQTVPVPGWMTFDDAARRLGISRQAARQAAIRQGWERGRIGDLVLVSRAAVDQYRHARQLSGPRKA